MADVEFTSEENLNRKRKYIIPWNQIDLESKQPIKKFILGDGRDMVCSEASIVNFGIDDGSFCFAQLDDTESFRSLTLMDPFDEEVTWPRAVSNDGTLAVGLVQKSTERMNLRSHGPVYEKNSFRFVKSTMLKIFNSDQELKITCKNLFGGQFMDVEHIKISPNNNLVAVIYSIYQQRFECKIFKLTEKGGFKHLRRFCYRHTFNDYDIGLFESSFNTREDLYMIRVYGDFNAILIYDIDKKNLVKVPCAPHFCYAQAYLICTHSQNLVYVYDEENIRSQSLSARS